LVAWGVHSASAAWGLRFDVSTNGGATWETSVNAQPGDVITFRFGAYFDPTTMVKTSSGTGPAQTLCRFTGQNQVVGLVPGDFIQNLVARTTNHHANVLAVAGGTIGTTGANSFASNLYLRGLPLTPTYYNAIYTGEIRLAESAALRTLTISNKHFGSGTIAGLTFFNGGYMPKQEIAAPIDNPNHVDIVASINVVPAPSALVLGLAAGAICGSRRRRVNL